MKDKTLGRLFADSVKAYNEECQKSASWKTEAHFWHDRALQAEFINEITPWLFMVCIVGVVVVAYFWQV